ncbi:HpcH/HpaI aldolase/citrate lyase family protein [Yinghuangia soli]|uniref:HpcH/HpaI aldolase/citrate lyase family protein n=1 Tax=Yinghuangia soli TaxID=2908204 RepID=A0AA41Q117_9ACTN|nr:HpcH/HpaI aldolase/citrate lyase family protein [Yinghuangia soli]MCF2528489.1 HpcH/HpaI aldolase/citrate lyase family protein [Yinghuangia soli]
MRHFAFLDDQELRHLFHRPPQDFRRDAEPAVLAAALGATLYSPATRTTLAADIAKQAARGVTSMVLCLEDAIDDGDVEMGEHNLVAQLTEHAESGADGPLLFVRVRAPEQITDLTERLGPALSALTGFVMPKFEPDSGARYLKALVEASLDSGRRLLGMPVLESPCIAYLEYRQRMLTELSALIAAHREHILAVRIGATDFSSAYALRRSRDLTAYDVHLVAGLIADIVNVFGRSDGTGFVISGPVWEYFPQGERLFKPQLRRSPFAEAEDPAEAVALRARLISADLDGLIRELELDKANGLLGKTAIHPSHVAVIHAMSVVTHEEFSDATDILAESAAGGGVLRSAYTNKMNEVKPHRAWAEAVMRRAGAFGVANEDVSFVDLLAATASAQAGTADGGVPRHTGPVRAVVAPRHREEHAHAGDADAPGEGGVSEGDVPGNGDM